MRVWYAHLMSVVLYGLLKYHAHDGEAPLMAVMV